MGARVFEVLAGLCLLILVGVVVARYALGLWVLKRRIDSEFEEFKRERRS